MKTLQEFLDALGKRESGGNYQAFNKFGFAGKYQMGEAALIDAGYYKKKGAYNNDWKGTFLGRDNVYNIFDFLNNPKAQENAQIAFKRRQWLYLKAVGADKFLGQFINGYCITQSGLLAGAHLKGAGGVAEYLNSRGTKVPKDAFGTSIESYMKNFAGYDVSSICK